MARSVLLSWIDNLAWRAEARGYAVNADSASETETRHLGMTPAEMMVASLGLCKAMDIAFYARRHPEINLSQVTLELSWEDAPDKPSRISAIRCTIHCPDDLPADVRATLVRVSNTCKVQRTLEQGVEVTVVVE